MVSIRPGSRPPGNTAARSGLTRFTTSFNPPRQSPAGEPASPPPRPTGRRAFQSAPAVARRGTWCQRGAPAGHEFQSAPAVARRGTRAPTASRSTPTGFNPPRQSPAGEHPDPDRHLAPGRRFNPPRQSPAGERRRRRTSRGPTAVSIRPGSRPPGNSGTTPVYLSTRWFQSAPAVARRGTWSAASASWRPRCFNPPRQSPAGEPLNRNRGVRVDVVSIRPGSRPPGNPPGGKLPQLQQAVSIRPGSRPPGNPSNFSRT